MSVVGWRFVVACVVLTSAKKTATSPSQAELKTQGEGDYSDKSKPEEIQQGPPGQEVNIANFTKTRNFREDDVKTGEFASAEDYKNTFPSKLCSRPQDDINGTIKSYRYYYNVSTNSCEEFEYLGNKEFDNYFYTVDQCQHICQATKENQTARNFKASRMECKLEVQLLDKCSLTANLRRIARCAKEPFFDSNEEKCTRVGCCWHHSYKICYQYVANTVLGESCWIISSSSSEFYGVARFQTLRSQRRGWIAYLTFTRAVSGSFCMAKTRFRQNIEIGERFWSNRGILLEGNKRLSAGERVNLAFVGTFGRAPLDRGLCDG